MAVQTTRGINSVVKCTSNKDLLVFFNPKSKKPLILEQILE
jgi:hypothetical protein